jgi:putative transposase
MGFKAKVNIGMQMNLHKGRHSVHKLRAHLIFVTKRRGKVFRHEHLIHMKGTFESVMRDFGGTLVEYNGEADHVHLLIDYPPKHSISTIVNSLKGVSSRRLMKDFPQIGEYWSVARSGHVLWSPSYFSCSVGGAPIEVLKKYIENQNQPSAEVPPP